MYISSVLAISSMAHQLVQFSYHVLSLLVPATAVSLTGACLWRISMPTSPVNWTKRSWALIWKLLRFLEQRRKLPSADRSLVQLHHWAPTFTHNYNVAQRRKMSMCKALVQLLLLAAVVAHQGASAAVASSSRSKGSSSSRHLLQNQWLWTRESAAVTAGLTLVPALIANGNGAAEGIKTGARGLEIARLASNKAAAPYEYDRPAAPVQKPARQQNALGRRLRSLLE